MCHIYLNNVNIRTMCQFYSKLTLKTPERCLVFLLLTYFAIYFTVNIAELEQKIPVSPVKL